MISHGRLADEIEVFADAVEGRCRDGTVRCLRALAAYTRACGPVGCDVEDAAAFMVEWDPVLDLDLVVQWLRSTDGFGVRASVCH